MLDIMMMVTMRKDNIFEREESVRMRLVYHDYYNLFECLPAGLVVFLDF